MKEYEMNELKLCSYCKSVPQANTWTLHGISETRYFCPNPECPHSVRTVTLEDWQTSPIEVALNKRIAELEATIDQLIEAGEKMQALTGWSTYDEATKDWKALAKDWKECEE